MVCSEGPLSKCKYLCLQKETYGYQIFRSIFFQHVLNIGRKINLDKKITIK